MMSEKLMRGCIIFLIVLLVIFTFHGITAYRTRKQHEVSKSWLFLVNGEQVQISSDEKKEDEQKQVITIQFKEIESIAFTDRPYHQVVYLQENSTYNIVSEMMRQQNPPNASFVLSKNNETSTGVFRIDNVDLDENKNTILKCTILTNTNFEFKKKYDKISVTVDNCSFFNCIGHWVKKAATNVADAAKKVVESCKKGLKECGRSFCVEATWPILEHLASEAGIGAICASACADGTGEILVEGGGPEDPVAVVAATTYGAGCALVCKGALTTGYYAWQGTQSGKAYGEFLGKHLCGSIFK